jgi:phospholipase C
MLENRSFDHLLGFLKATNPQVMGLNGDEFNRRDPNSPDSPPVTVARATSFTMTFDPAHEHYDVQMQLYGPQASSDPARPPVANPPVVPAPMSGFVFSALHAEDFDGDEVLVMGCFQPDQLPTLTMLAKEFALFNFWYSARPGQTGSSSMPQPRVGSPTAPPPPKSWRGSGSRTTPSTSDWKRPEKHGASTMTGCLRVPAFHVSGGITSTR